MATDAESPNAGREEVGDLTEALATEMAPRQHRAEAGAHHFALLWNVVALGSHDADRCEQLSLFDTCRPNSPMHWLFFRIYSPSLA